VRRDVVEGLIDQGVTVLRYGGSMVNHEEYRWKKMVGPRDQRPPNPGTWYEHSSNGWGIPDFLDMCAAAGFLGIPDFNINETPEDMVDFIEYANGPEDSPWGRRRAEAGHPEPYHLKYIELGNEERVDDTYASKFEGLARAIWAKDPQIILVVGDFSYHRVIQDPMHFTGADSGITNLLGQARILKLTKECNREVWFDIHVWTEGPKSDPSLAAALSYTDALDRLAAGAAHRVLVFELNANNHSQRRALANAVAINTAQRDGRWPIVTSANGLQVDGQNDNGWDQGLLFLNPGSVWLQPPGYVTRMIARNYEPLAVRTDLTGDTSNLDVSATRSEDGRTVVLQVVNTGREARPVKLQLSGFTPTRPSVRVEELSGALNSHNTATAPDQCRTSYKYWQPAYTAGAATYICPPYSFTVLRFE
jgi:alpha-L-arabinofuranosidase